MSTYQQIRQIHTIKTKIGLDDDTYRDMLASFDVCSSKQLTFTEAQILIDILNDKAKLMDNKYAKYEDRDTKMASVLQLRKMEFMWDEIHTETSKYSTLREFLQGQFHEDDIRFLTKAKAGRIISVMEKIKLHQCLKAV